MEQPGLATLKGARILVIDDERLIAEDIAETLRDHKVEVCGPLHSLDEALEWIEFSGDNLFAAVVDIYFNDVPSWAVADELMRRGVPFVFLSGFLDMGLPARYAAVPRCAKPCDHKLLLKLLVAEIRKNRH